MNCRSLGKAAPAETDARKHGRLFVEGKRAMYISGAVDAVRSAVTALNEGKIDGYLGHFDPSSKRWLGGAATPLSLTDIGDHLHQMQAAFEGLHLDEDLLFGDERFVCARWRLRGRHVGNYLGLAPTGQSIDFETCEVYEVDAGRVIATWVYGDLDQLVRQISPREDTT